MNYRFGFQGQEMDNEIKGEGNSVTFRYRIHDPRLGRFFSVDPLSNKFPWWTPYQFAGNTPIEARELEGLETYHTSLENGEPNPEPIRDPITGWELHGPITPAALEETEKEWHVEIDYMGFETDVFQDKGIGNELAELPDQLENNPSELGNTKSSVDKQYALALQYLNPYVLCYMATLARVDNAIGTALNTFPFTDGNGNVLINFNYAIASVMSIVI